MIPSSKHWYEKPLVCLIGLHKKKQHPGVWWLWWCELCHQEDEYRWRR